ncbi:MAG: TonB family protein [Bacteroidia bacterium]|nr:TonB family protein [Bacteroidia bacterium]
MKKIDWKDKDSKFAGIIGTIAFHALLLLALLFYGMQVCLPQEEEGLTVNYGTSDTGEGLFEPAPQSAIEDQLEDVPDATTPPLIDNSSANSELQTQNIEESIEVKEAKKQELERQRLLAEQKRQEEEKRKIEEAKRAKATSAAKNAFGKGGKGTDNNATGEGVTGGAGNQGNPFGDVNSQNHTGGGTGNGHSYNLNGRSLSGKIPEPKYDKNEEGIIVVSIEVDPSGKVISAKSGAIGTTIGDASMRKEAEIAAMRAKFNGISGSTVQSGTITYKYKLN